MIPFPQFLETPCWRNDGKLRVVSDLSVKPGTRLSCPVRKQSYEVQFVTSSRFARGDWSAYPTRPIYYECLASVVAEQLSIDQPPERYEPKQKQVFPV